MIENPTAFPCQEIRSGGFGIREASDGMSLRDWFAGQCLPGVMTQAQNMGSLSADDRKEAWSAVAVFVYEMADAMLAARRDA